MKKLAIPFLMFLSTVGLPVLGSVVLPAAASAQDHEARRGQQYGETDQGRARQDGDPRGFAPQQFRHDGRDARQDDRGARGDARDDRGGRGDDRGYDRGDRGGRDERGRAGGGRDHGARFGQRDGRFGRGH